MKFKRLIKIVVINSISFVILLYAVNWGCGLILKRGQKGREALPNYAHDLAYAKEIFKDYNSIKHTYEPFTGWKMLPYSGKTLHINQDGHRIHTAPEFPGNKKTAWFFGGSTLWGEGSDDQHTIPALFNNLHPEYDVTNFGQLAYNARQNLDALISQYSKGKASDLVVFYDGVNDAAFLCPTEIKKLPAHRLVPYFNKRIYGSKSALIADFLYKMFLENILRLIESKRDDRSQEQLYDCISRPEKAEEIASIFVKNWEMAHQLVSSKGGTFVAVLQPSAFIGNPKTDHLTLDHNFRMNFAAVYLNISRILKEKNYDWAFDLTQTFDQDAYIYIDFCHVSPNGNQLMADSISAVIKKIIP